MRETLAEASRKAACAAYEIATRPAGYRYRPLMEAIADTGLVRLDIRLRRMVPVDGSECARLLADAYNSLAKAHVAYTSSS